MFKGQPKGLFALALANTGERFGYYTMLAIFLLFLQAKFGFTAAAAGQFYAIFLAAVYFMPVLGGWLADKIGFGKCVVTGISVMFLGYLALAIPTDAFANRGLALAMMIGALLLIAVGTGLFKGNLQVMTGNLYDDPKYSAKRDSGFSLFYMAINLGAMFAPTAATALTNSHLAKSGLIYKADIPALAHQCLNGTLQDPSALEGLQAMMPGADVAVMNLTDFSQYYINQLSTAYNLGFAVACVSLIVSMAIYFGFRSWFKHTDVNAKQAAAASENVLLYFPAGLCSRKQKGGQIRDLEWKPTFIKKAVKYKRDVVPFFFDARNRKRFYNLARLRERLGVKFNFEMALLPGEMFAQRGKTMRFTFGKPIPYTTFDDRHTAKEWAQMVKDHCYRLKDNPDAEFLQPVK